MSEDSYNEIRLTETQDVKVLFQMILKRNYHISATHVAGKLFIKLKEYPEVRRLISMYGLNE